MSRVVISIYDDERNPHYGGGGAVVVRRVAERLGRDHDVTVVSGSFRGWRTGRPMGYRRRYLRVGWAGPRGGQLLFHLLLPLYAARGDYDVWLESFTPPVSTSFLPLFSRGRPVLGLVQMLTAQDSAARYRLPFEAVERRGLRVYRDFLVLNEADRDAIAAVNPQARCHLVPNGVGLPEHVAPGAGSYVLFLGRVDVRQKGLDLLLDAYSRSDCALPLVVAGSGRRAQERLLRRHLARARGPVSWVGHIGGRAKDELLANAAFVVLPSRYETFGLSALEAMAHGKPVVHFDLERLRWIPPEAGPAVQAEDVEALAQVLTELGKDDERRVAMGRAARATAELYDRDLVTEAYTQVVRDLLEGAQPAAGPGRESH